MKCPICENEIKNRRFESIQGSVGEEHAKCYDDYHFYSYSFAYGNEEETIGNVVFHSHHADPKEQRELISKQYKAVLELEKEQYLLSKSKGADE